MPRRVTPMSKKEFERIHGSGLGYSKGSIDRMNGLLEPAEPDEIDYMRGWYSRMGSQVHTEDSDYAEVAPVIAALTRDWQAHCRARGWPDDLGLPL